MSGKDLAHDDDDDDDDDDHDDDNNITDNSESILLHRVPHSQAKKQSFNQFF